MNVHPLSIVFNMNVLLVSSRPAVRTEYFDQEYNRTESDEFKALLKPESSMHKFSAFAPVLHPPGSHMDSKKIFQSLILVNVCLLLCILHAHHF